MPFPTALAPFRIRGYRFQWPADLVVSWAFEMETLILGWYVLVETGSVLYLTAYGALLYGGTLIAPMIGVASDRIGHRSLLSGMRAIYALVAAALMALAFAGVLNPMLVLVIAAVSGLVRPSDMGLRGAVIADAMPANLLTGAMSFSRTTSDIARITGALTGAGLFAAFGIAPAYVAITILYALGSLLTWFAAPDRNQIAEPAAVIVQAGASAWSELREGIVHIWNTPSLLAIVWLALLFNFTAFPLTNGLLPYVAKEIYRIDQTGLGYLVAAIGFGALLGALLMTWFSAEVQLSRVMFIAAVIWHLLILVFIQMQTLAGGVVMLCLCGVAQSLTMVCHTVILLRTASQRFRGRVLGVRMLAIYSLPLGLLIAGALIERIGFRWTASLFAGTGLFFTVLIAMKWHSFLAQAEPADKPT
jgi:predicted MFS family arabinose efflux permease